MSKDIPEIDDLTKGINDSELILTQDTAGTQVEQKENNNATQEKINIDKSIGDNIIMMFVGWWERHGNPNFLTNSGISDIGGQITYNETFVEIIKR